jgi:hypothetical protein
MISPLKGIHGRLYLRVGYLRVGLLIFIMWLVCFLSAPLLAQTDDNKAADQTVDPQVQQRLDKTARDSLKRLKYAMKKDGFYSSRVALNIWRIAAMNAGSFDADAFEKYKKDIYEASIERNLGWFENFLMQGDFINAEICLNIWRIHSKEIDTFSQEQFDEMENRLEEAKMLKSK